MKMDQKDGFEKEKGLENPIKETKFMKRNILPIWLK